jgi:hypothetical protein
LWKTILCPALTDTVSGENDIFPLSRTMLIVIADPDGAGEGAGVGELGDALDPLHAAARSKAAPTPANKADARPSVGIGRRTFIAPLSGMRQPRVAARGCSGEKAKRLPECGARDRAVFRRNRAEGLDSAYERSNGLPATKL